MLDTGASGVVAKFVVVIPFLMSVLPTRITRTPSAFEHEVEVGELRAAAARPGRPGPSVCVGSVGVLARAPPTFEPSGQLNGFAANICGRHAFWSVVSRDGSCLGSVTSTDLMSASPERLVDRRFEARAVLARRFAARGRRERRFERERVASLRPGTASTGSPSPTHRPDVKPLTTDSVCEYRAVGRVALEALAVDHDVQRTYADRDRRRRSAERSGRSRPPGAVSDLTSIFARATTVGSENGPAIGGTTIDRPNGAPA